MSMDSESGICTPGHIFHGHFVVLNYRNLAASKSYSLKYSFVFYSPNDFQFKIRSLSLMMVKRRFLTWPILIDRTEMFKREVSVNWIELLFNTVIGSSSVTTVQAVL